MGVVANQEGPTWRRKVTRSYTGGRKRVPLPIVALACGTEAGEETFDKRNAHRR